MPDSSRFARWAPLKQFSKNRQDTLNSKGTSCYDWRKCFVPHKSHSCHNLIDALVGGSLNSRTQRGSFYSAVLITSPQSVLLYLGTFTLEFLLGQEMLLQINKCHCFFKSFCSPTAGVCCKFWRVLFYCGSGGHRKAAGEKRPTSRLQIMK